jgi:hypothetical protein
MYTNKSIKSQLGYINKVDWLLCFYKAVMFGVSAYTVHYGLSCDVSVHWCSYGYIGVGMGTLV